MDDETNHVVPCAGEKLILSSSLSGSFQENLHSVMTHSNSALFDYQGLRRRLESLLATEHRKLLLRLMSERTYIHYRSRDARNLCTFECCLLFLIHCVICGKLTISEIIRSVGLVPLYDPNENNPKLNVEMFWKEVLISWCPVLDKATLFELHELHFLSSRDHSKRRTVHISLKTCTRLLGTRNCKSSHNTGETSSSN